MKRLMNILAMSVASIALGGCILTEHQHFDPVSGIEVPLKMGTYQCSTTASRQDGSVRDTSKLAWRITQHISFFDGEIETVKMPGAGNRIMLFQKNDPTSALVYAFHAVAPSVYAVGTAADESTKSHLTWFFRITAESIEPIMQQDRPALAKLAAAAGVELDERVDESSGDKEKELAFLQSVAASGVLKPLSKCLRVAS